MTPHPVIPLGDWNTTPVLHYGSNLNRERLKERSPDWDGEGLVVQLDGWSWAIDKQAWGKSTSGSAGIQPGSGAVTWGVVTPHTAADLAELDEAEGGDYGHDCQERVLVRSHCGAMFEALAYVPCDYRRRSGLEAEASYKRHILSCLDHWDLPVDRLGVACPHGACPTGAFAMASSALSPFCRPEEDPFLLLESSLRCIERILLFSEGQPLRRTWIEHPYGEEEITLLEEEVLPVLQHCLQRVNEIDAALQEEQGALCPGPAARRAPRRGPDPGLQSADRARAHGRRAGALRPRAPAVPASRGWPTGV